MQGAGGRNKVRHWWLNLGNIQPVSGAAVNILKGSGGGMEHSPPPQPLLAPDSARESSALPKAGEPLGCPIRRAG